MHFSHYWTKIDAENCSSGRQSGHFATICTCPKLRPHIWLGNRAIRSWSGHCTDRSLVDYCYNFGLNIDKKQSLITLEEKKLGTGGRQVRERVPGWVVDSLMLLSILLSDVDFNLTNANTSRFLPNFYAAGRLLYTAYLSLRCRFKAQ